MADTLSEGPAHGATFYLPTDGAVRFRFNTFHARLRSLVDWRPGTCRAGTRLSLPRGPHTLSLYDITVTARVSILFQPEF
jgi:hypothetical protein